MGAPKESYTELTPPHSFIHVDDFDSPQHLAEYLIELDNDDDLYNSYFKWKTDYEIILRQEALFCRVCEMLHERDGEVSWYKDFGDWWGGPGICADPTDDNPYGSWNLTTIT